jgi:signal transduction histidine kinase
MTDQPVVSEEGASELRGTLAQVAIASLMFATLLVYIWALVLAMRTARGPFLGAFAEPTLVVNSVGDDDWHGRAAGLDLPDHLVALDERPLTHPWSLYDGLSDYEIGDVVTLEVERQSGERRQVLVELQSFPTSALVSFFVVPYGIGLVYLIIGLVVFVARRDRAPGRAFPLFCVAFALTTGMILDLYTTHRLMYMWAIGLALLGGSLIDLALVFPRRSRLALRRPWLRRFVFLPSAALAIWALVTITNFGAPWAYIAAWRFLFFYGALGAILWFAMLLWRRFRADSLVAREQSRIILLGTLVAFLPIVIWALGATLEIGLDFQPALLFAPLILLPLSIAYAILRYRLLDVDLIISRGVSYGLLTLLIVGSYLLIVNLFGLLLGTAVEADSPALVALFVVIVSLTLNPLRTRLQRSVDQLFFRGRINYRQELEAYSHELGRLLSQSDILAALSQRVETAVHPERLLFYLYDERAAQFTLAPDSQGHAGGVPFAADGGLARLLVEQHESVYLMAGQSLPEELAREASQLEAVGALLFIPFAQRGWMALGEKRSGEPYTSDDMDYLEALGDQTSLALERMQLISTLERRVNELDALHWISQAISFSVGLDDLLELIYAQTSRVLDTSNFYIALYDEAKETLSYAFYVENDERYYPDDEWPLGVGLTSEIIRQGQPIVTDDYMGECLRRNIPPAGKAERAWMGVPLNAGDRLEGVMTVSSSEPGVRYTPDQLKIFSAVADQAAAIVDKARLYSEMEERARQLVILNEVGSAISSSLDLQTVLNLITEKAADILEAEAGSLFLTDPETGELVFQVAVGPTGGELVGLRLPPGTGIVGATAQTQEPIIVNDVQQDRRWFSGPDESGGFITRALLSVPLVSKDESIGVLQVLNKRDDSPFDEQNQQLLMSFASQAAVAIENASLFKQTDEALAARVAELSMFQQIDHALNATLDYSRVIELTLDWAMLATEAEVGVVATLDEESGGLFVVASRGYPPEFDRYREKPWPVSNGIVGRVVRTGQTAVVDDVAADPDYVMIAPKTRAQLTVPIRMGAQVVGVINLESSEEAGFREDDVHFVTRLADRAVVPIQNAKLYEQVKKANEAKSQFVSVVAHELKIPMTSIKGYARLLELGYDSIDESRKDFIKTITSNVDRMSKMVNDLLDISRIETGRLKLEMEEVSIANIVDETLDSLRSDIEEKELELKLSVPEDLPVVWGDRTRLVQVLINLVSNAYKYTIEGSVHIEAEAVELPTPYNGDLGNFVRCSVRDTGIGISPENQERLFKSQFVRFENAVDVAPGHGLGLWLVNRLTQMQGGELTFESELGKGSTFAFTVPVAGDQVLSVGQVK